MLLMQANTEAKSKKSNFKNKIIIFLLILILVLSGSTYYFYKVASGNPEQITRILQNIPVTSYIDSAKAEHDLIQKIPKSPISVNSLQISGWIPDWDMTRGLASVRDHQGLFSEVSPVFYNVKNDGSLQKIRNNFPDQQVMQYCRNNNIKVIPTITISNSVAFDNVLKDPNNIQRHVDSIVSEVTTNNYDGIDLDYESIEYNDKDAFYKFLENISQRLHAVNKSLTLTTISKWGDKINYWVYPQTRLVLDYKKISDLVDNLRIMVYDFYGKGSAKVGPHSPLDLEEAVIQYVIFVGVPRNKITVAIPTYAYDWPEMPLADDNIDLINIDPFTINPNGSGTPDALSYRAVESVTDKYNMTSSFNQAWGLAVGRYTFNGKNRIVIYENDQSIALRKQLAADYGIKGIAYWRIGDEADLKI